MRPAFLKLLTSWIRVQGHKRSLQDLDLRVAFSLNKLRNVLNMRGGVLAIRGPLRGYL